MNNRIKNMVVIGATTLALAAGGMALPSVANARGGHGGGGHMGGGHFAGGHMGGGHFGGRHFAGGRHFGGRGYAYGGGGYYGGYCGPIRLAAGLCSPYYY